MPAFSAEVPKGDAWGIEQAIADAVRRINAGEKSPLIPVMAMIDIKTIKLDPETHSQTAIVRVRRITGLTSIENVRAAHRIAMEEAARLAGEGAVLPFEVKTMIDEAFSGIDVKTIEQDENEKQADEAMTDNDRLRRHMVVVHGYDANDALIIDKPDNVVALQHEEEHKQAEDDEMEPVDFPAHDVESLAWRRVDVADLLADSEEPETEIEVTLPADPDAVPDSPASLFDDGQAVDSPAETDEDDQTDGK